MTAERRQRVKELFEVALQRPPAERAAMLKELCPDDAELRNEMERLIAGYQDLDSDELLREPAPAGQPLPFAPQQVVAGRFQIVRFISKGGMGAVYEAEDQVLRERVALKIIRPDVLVSARVLERFKREIKMARRILHPNVCRIHDVFAHRIPEQGATVLLLSMELLSGETLAERIRRDGPAGPAEALAIADQLSSALEAAHAAGVVHRDVKSSNVMLVRESGERLRAVLTDFGLARSLAAEDATISLAGEIAGTPGYMAPEQEQGVATAASDIYSFGVVLYELVTGRRPFPRGASGLRPDRTQAPTPPSVCNPRLDTRWDAVILRCLERDPARRFSHARQIAGALHTELCETVTERRLSRRQVLVRGAPLIAAAVGVLSWQTARWLRGPNFASLAVLPFAILNGALDLDYLTDGVTDELIGALTAVPGIRVIHRSSAFQFKGREADLRDVARRLKVNTVLQGNIRKTGARLQIAAQLVDASDGHYLWSKTYQAGMDSLMGVEDEIVRAATETLRQSYPAAHIGPAPGIRATDFETYTLYLRGRHLWNQRSPESLKKALEHFRAASARDPKYAAAFSGIADTYIALVDYGALPARSGMPEAKRAVENALSIDPQLAEAHASLGQIAGLYDWDWGQAERSLRRAIELNPRYSTAHLWYGSLLLREEKLLPALDQVREALVSDPLSLGVNIHLAWILFYLRNFPAAIEQANKTLELDRSFVLPYHMLAESYARLGRATEALQAASTALSLSHRQASSVTIHGTTCALIGRRAEAMQTLRELEGLRRTREVPASYPAMLAATLGLKDTALGWLEEAYSERESGVLLLKIYPSYDSLRGEPRYLALVRKLGYPA